MRKSILAYPLVPQFSKSDIAYASNNDRLSAFFVYPQTLAGLAQAMEDRANRTYPRKDLVAALKRQYQDLPSQEQVSQNIDALAQPNGFCITTAHQPSLFLGPLYFVYKALSAIVLAEAAEAQSGGKCRVVPVFVLGSEDHDLEEVNKANIFGKQLIWRPEESGAVGGMSTEQVRPVLAELRAILGESESAAQLYATVEQCYTGAKTFAEATQALLHAFFGRFGLVVLNMNDAALKRHFIPIIREELLEQPSYALVNQTIAKLAEKGFKTQAAPREINLFYLKPGMRERIVLEDGRYKVLQTTFSFSREELLQELETHPEHFSPNVVLRPLYQELILPNLAYVGGGGELAYWLERKSLFEHFGLPFPVLIRRHSVLWLDRDTGKKLHKLGFSPSGFFADTDALVRHFIEKNADSEVDLSTETRELKQLYEQLAAKAMAIDPTLEKAVLAESVKAVAGLEQWQSRLMRAEKQKHETSLNQLRSLKEKLYPGNGLQERHDNFLPYILKYGDAFLDTLKANFNPFDPGILILEED